MSDEDLTLLRELGARQAIRDCLARYCRGLDRMDRELILTAYHPDAVDDHGSFVGVVHDFVDQLFVDYGTNPRNMQHIIANHSCELDGDVAHAETYWMYAASPTAGKVSFAGGRYIDRFEKRGGQWKIAQRLSLCDWFDEPSPTRDRLNDGGPPAQNRSDPSYLRPLTVRAPGTHRPL